MRETPLLLIEPDPQTAAFLRNALAKAHYDVSLAAGGKEGLIAAWRDQPDIILLELNLPDIDGLEVVRRLRKDARTERKTIIALTSRTAPEDAVAGAESGLSYYIHKQADAVEVLIRYLTSLRNEAVASSADEEAIPLGHLITFLSAKGGVGVSSICANVASRLAHLDPDQSVVVVDLGLPMGTLAAITGVTSPVDLYQLSELEPFELTPERLRRDLPVAAVWGFQLVTGCATPTVAANLNIDNLAPLLQALRRTYGCVFVDLGRNLSRVALLVLAQTDIPVMVMSPDPIVAAMTRAALAFLEAEGLSTQRAFLVSNRPLGGEDLTGPPLENALGRPVDRGLPFIGRNFNLANNFHVPLHTRFPEETASEVVDDIASMLMQRLKTPLPSLH